MEILLVFVAIFLKQKHGNFSFSESSLGNSCHFYRVAKNKGLKWLNQSHNRFIPYHESEPESSLSHKSISNHHKFFLCFAFKLFFLFPF